MPRVFNLSFSQVALFGEAAVTLAMAALLVRCLPFRWLAPRLGQAACESAADEPEAIRAHLGQLRWALHAAARRSPLGSSCLTRAIAGKAMLKRRGIASTLYLGVDTGGATGLSAHAWLRCGTFLVTGAGGREQFATVATFAE